jgi:hypothetical protein
VTVKKKHPGGRPPINKTPAEIQEKADAYFNDTQRPTVSGLARAMGYANRVSLIDNHNRGEEFADTIKRAVGRVEQAYEERLYESGCAGAIFALKNMGWSDRQEVEHAGGLTINLVKYADTNSK